MKECYEAIVKRDIVMITTPGTIIEELKLNVLGQLKADDVEPTDYLFTLYNEDAGFRLEAVVRK